MITVIVTATIMTKWTMKSERDGWAYAFLTLLILRKSDMPGHCTYADSVV